MADKKTGPRLHVTVDKDYLTSAVGAAVVELSEDFHKALLAQVRGAMERLDMAGEIEARVADEARIAVNRALRASKIEKRVNEAAQNELARLVQSGTRASRIETVLDNHLDDLETLRESMWHVQSMSDETRTRLQSFLTTLRNSRQPADGGGGDA